MKRSYILKNWLIGEWWKELRCIKGHPKEVSSSLALGVVIGFTPTIGFQTALCYGIARLFKKSFLISFGGSCLVTGIPIIIPVVYYGEYQLGCRILKISPLIHFIHPLHFRFLLSLGKPILVGSIVSAVIGGLFSYIITFIILKFFRKEKI